MAPRFVLSKMNHDLDLESMSERRKRNGLSGVCASLGLARLIRQRCRRDRDALIRRSVPSIEIPSDQRRRGPAAGNNPAG
jgi:hypothetical protein